METAIDMPISMNLNNLNSDVTISTGFFRSSRTSGDDTKVARRSADVCLPGERSRGGLSGPFARVASSHMTLPHKPRLRRILSGHPGFGMVPVRCLRHPPYGQSFRSFAFIAFVNGKCDQTGIGCAERVAFTIAMARNGSGSQARKRESGAEFSGEIALCGKQNGQGRGPFADPIMLPANARKKTTHATLYAHPMPTIPSLANSAAPSLWREMDKFAPPSPYAFRGKKVLLNRHKTGHRFFLVYGAAQRKARHFAGL